VLHRHVLAMRLFVCDQPHAHAHTCACVRMRLFVCLSADRPSSNIRSSRACGAVLAVLRPLNSPTTYPPLALAAPAACSHPRRFSSPYGCTLLHIRCCSSSQMREPSLLTPFPLTPIPTYAHSHLRPFPLTPIPARDSSRVVRALLSLADRVPSVRRRCP
jgi:hypothetical protein